MRCQVALLHLADDLIGHFLELVGRSILDTRRMADEQVVRRGVWVDIAVSTNPFPFGAMHVVLHPNLHPPITAFFNPESPVGRDVWNTIDAALKESLEVALVPQRAAVDWKLSVGRLKHSS